MNADELKIKLSEFIEQNSIAKFGPEDVFELVAEGESIEWIVNQLKGDKQIDEAAITSLLTEIQSQVAPDKSLEEAQPADAAADAGIADVSQIDPSQLDPSQIGPMLPEGVQLPEGMDLEEIKTLLESPQGKILSDFLVFCQEKGIDLNQDNLNDSRTHRLRTEWLSTPRDACEGRTPAEMLAGAQSKVETFRRSEPHVGRNDPCPCGSGKKFKKCCGRA